MEEGPSLKTPRTTLRRKPERGRHDFETIAAILDEALICHLGFVQDGQPYVVPTAFGREGGRVYFHGSNASRTIRSLTAGAEVCLTATIVDSVVLARSAFHMSMDYRSVMVLGRARPAEGDDKVEGLRAIVEHTAAGRWDDIRWPVESELKQTTVLCLDLAEASAKVRDSGVGDEEEDYALPVWAGIIPLSLTPGAPVPDPRLAPGTPSPAYATKYARRGVRQ